MLLEIFLFCLNFNIEDSSYITPKFEYRDHKKMRGLR